MKLQELIFSFFRVFFRWLGAGLAILIFLALIAALSSSSPEVKVRSLPPKGFENVSWKGQPSIALIRIDSEIGTPHLNRTKIRQLLEACQSNTLKGKIKAILLEIDSPGGSSVDSEGIYELLQNYKQLYQVPIYAFVDGYCASGGYLIACACDKIFTTKYSYVGSVGVIAHLVNYSATMEKLGLKGLIFKRGIGKDALDPMKPVDEAERSFIEPLLDSNYERFIQVVSSARPMLNQKVLENIVGARAYPADEAKRLGYVDEIGYDRSMVVAALANQAGLTSDFALIELKPTSGWSDIFIESSMCSLKTCVNQMATSQWQINLR